MKCSQCGAELTNDAAFCSFCGHKIEKVSDETTTIESNEQQETISVDCESHDEINEVHPTTSGNAKIEDDDKDKDKDETNVADTPLDPINEIEPDENKEFVTKNVSDEALHNTKSTSQVVLDSLKSHWDKLNLFYKFVSIGFIAFIVLTIIGFACHKTLAGFIGVAQIAILIVAILMEKQIIKTQKSWFSIVALVLSFLMVIPYGFAFSSNNRNLDTDGIVAEKLAEYRWSDIVLKDLLPEPESKYGEIISNSKDELILYVNGVTPTQYHDYFDACKVKGFVVDLKQTGNLYSVSDESGCKLSLNYDEDDLEMSINLDTSMKFDTIEWPQTDMAKLIPIPKSNYGRINQNDSEGFIVYIGKTSVDEYNSYVAACAENGFSVDADKQEKKYSAKNENSFKLSVEYLDDATMCISVLQPGNTIDIEVECVENLFFSMYDVEVYADDLSLGTLKHGDTDTFTAKLNDGTHTIKFVSSEDVSLTGEVKVKISKDDTIKFKISCSSLGIRVTTVAGTVVTEATTTSQTTTKERSTTKANTTKSSPTTGTTAAKNSASYHSSNDRNIAKQGKTGVFAYRNTGGSYYLYWIIDFDKGYVYSFTDGNGDETCDRIKIDFGTLNDYVQITWHDGGTVWSYGLHFKYKEFPDTLIVEDHNHFDYKYITTDLGSALSVRNSKTIVDY